jgi:uncharacterized SAM-binding protein YcdF (DUF218 family)
MARYGADAIVVLGCRVSASGRLTTAAAGRAETAAEAFQAGAAPRIVTSGGRRWGATTEALALQQALVARGVPREAIHAELWSLTTYENAVFSAAMLRKLGARSAVIVSCAWHLPRALRSFRAAGLEVTAWPRPGTPGLYDRCAEAFRRVYDDLAIRRTTVLRGSADSFFEDAGR